MEKEVAEAVDHTMVGFANLRGDQADQAGREGHEGPGSQRLRARPSRPSRLDHRAVRWGQ